MASTNEIFNIQDNQQQNQLNQQHQHQDQHQDQHQKHQDHPDNQQQGQQQNFLQQTMIRIDTFFSDKPVNEKDDMRIKEFYDLDPVSWPQKERGSFYFEDGRRRVDFILVFKNKNDNKIEDLMSSESRRVFESNLAEEGIEIEYTNDSIDKTYVKLHAPWELLARYAEIMKLKMPMKTIQTNWKILFDEDETHAFSMKFTAAYSRDKEYLFNIPPQRELFFTSAQRAQVIEFILKRKSFSQNLNDATAFGINKLLSDKVYIGAYPLHEGNSLIHTLTLIF